MKPFLPHSSLRFPFLIIALLTCFPGFAQFGGSRPGNGGVFAVANPAQPGRITTVGGRLQPRNKIVHTVPVAGYVEAILVRVGDRVSEGQPLARFTRGVVGETFRPAPLESRLDGVVSAVQIYEKQEVGAGSPAITILDDRSLLLETALSDRDARDIRNLGRIPVTGITPEGKTFPGKILQLSLEPDYTTGLFTLTMEFPRTPDMFLGMVLFVDLPVQKAEGISVETSALVYAQGLAFLWLLDGENLLRRRPVTTGQTQGDSTLILEGLAAGDRYIRQPGGREEEGLGLRELIQANLGGRPAPGSP